MTGFGKCALLGLPKTMASGGAKTNVKVNVVALQALSATELTS